MLASGMFAGAWGERCIDLHAYLAGGVVHWGGDLLGVTLGSVVSATTTLVSTCSANAVS